MQGIDVVVLTKNSAKTVGQCLEAIRRVITGARIIVIDDSDDGGETAQIASKYADDIRVHPGNIGEKRDFALDLIETPIFAFVDSDVIVNAPAFQRSMEILRAEESVAAVHSRVRPTDRRDFSGSETKRNLTFGFALLRTAPIRQVRIPHQPRGEDPATGARLKKLGYEVAWQGEFPCGHLRTVVDVWRHYFQYGKRGHYEGHPLYAIQNLIRHPSAKSLVLQLYFMAGYADFRLRKLMSPGSDKRQRN